MSNTRSCGSTSSAPHTSTSGQVGSSVLAELRQACRERVDEPPGAMSSEVEVPRIDMEPFREHFLPMVTNVGPRRDSFETRMNEAGTADTDCVSEVRELR